MIVRWAPDRVPVSLEDRREASTWVIVHRVLNSSRVREFLDNESAQGFSQGVDFDIEHYHSFAEFAPTIAAAYGVGHCLFLAGFSPTDWADGTALTWVVVDVGRGSLEAVLRLSPPGFVLEGKRLNVERIGAAVRAFGPQFAYTTSRGMTAYSWSIDIPCQVCRVPSSERARMAGQRFIRCRDGGISGRNWRSIPLPMPLLLVSRSATRFPMRQGIAPVSG